MACEISITGGKLGFNGPGPLLILEVAPVEVGWVVTYGVAGVAGVEAGVEGLVGYTGRAG